jgi:hypothetical protein
MESSSVSSPSVLFVALVSLWNAGCWEETSVLAAGVVVLFV